MSVHYKPVFSSLRKHNFSRKALSLSPRSPQAEGGIPFRKPDLYLCTLISANAAALVEWVECNFLDVFELLLFNQNLKKIMGNSASDWILRNHHFHIPDPFNFKCCPEKVAFVYWDLPPAARFWVRFSGAASSWGEDLQLAMQFFYICWGLPFKKLYDVSLIIFSCVLIFFVLYSVW